MGSEMCIRDSQRPQGRCLKGLGLAQGRLGTRKWVQDGSNLSQLGANLGPCWVLIGSSRPSCSNYEGILRHLWAYATQDAKNDPKIIEFCSKKYQKLMLSKLPKSKNTFENVGPEANREKTTMNLRHISLEAILEPFWHHLGVLGRPLGSLDP